MSFNIISFLKAATNRSVPVADNNPLPVSAIDGATGSAVSYGFTPYPISTAATFNAIKSGPGMIGDITVNKVGTTDVITVYDALTATGTPIAIITSPLVGDKFCELLKFSIGLTIVTSGTPGHYTVSFQ